ncbi:MAG: hypothetical protein KBA91_02730 [Candidatus Moranbacteria bacterium]|nr:hypothetical protein [Candidatus Moranbacteria bacterium]
MKQVQIVCDSAKRAAGRLAQVEPPKMEDNEDDVSGPRSAYRQDGGVSRYPQGRVVCGKRGA